MCSVGNLVWNFFRVLGVFRGGFGIIRGHSCYSWTFPIVLTKSRDVSSHVPSFCLQPPGLLFHTAALWRVRTGIEPSQPVGRLAAGDGTDGAFFSTTDPPALCVLPWVV